jgi:beta-lactamase class A
MKQQNLATIKLLLQFFTILILFTSPAVQAKLTTADQTALAASIQKIETRLDARIGVSVHDTNSRKTIQYKGDQRFPLTSTFKALACAAVLARVDANEEDLNRAILIQPQDIVTYSPTTEKYINKTMTIAELCAATITLSDNTAGNLILKSIGGPEGFTQFMRKLGDRATQLSRWEPELNEATPGDVRDTTTPNAIIKSLNRLLLGNKLSASSKLQLTQWMIDDKVANGLMRSILPSDWKIGDKTGAGAYGSRAIVAIIWPPKQKPVLVSIYITQTKTSMDERNQAIVDISNVIKDLLVE